MSTPTIMNQRSSEIGTKPEQNFTDLISTVSYQEINQDEFDKGVDDRLKSLNLKDFYNDNFASIKNIIRELYSIKMGWQQIHNNGEKYDAILFLRPDLHYHDKIDSLNMRTH